MNLIKTRIDSKGRISIPYHMRSNLEIDGSSKLMISASEREIFITPSVEGVKSRMRFRNFSNMLKAMKIISGYGINIASERILHFDRNNIEWSATLEGDAGTIKKAISRIKRIRDARVS